MKKSFKKYLLLEQLEERIFLDANPVAALDSVDPLDSTIDPAAELITDQPVLPPQPDVSAAPEGSDSDSTAREADSEQDLMIPPLVPLLVQKVSPRKSLRLYRQQIANQLILKKIRCRAGRNSRIPRTKYQ